MKILFSEKDHKYYLDVQPDKPFTSVSKVLSSIKKPFDSDYWSKKKAVEAEITQKEILDQWKTKSQHACSLGSHVHKLFEDDLISKGAKVHKEHDGLKEAFSLKELQNLEDGIYPELIIPHIPSWTIGTADYIRIEGKDFFIEDLKTNEDLQLEPKKYYKKELGYADYTYLLTPVGHIIETKFNVYQLQLSLYSYYLECLGYNFKGGIIRHVIVDETKTNSELTIEDIPNLESIQKVIDYPITYMKDEVIAILKSFKNSNR